jgi:hypothetical protein
MLIIYKGMAKAKVVPLYATKAHRWRWGIAPPVPIGQEAGWTPEPVWIQRLEEKSCRLFRGSNLDRPVVQPVARQYTDWARKIPSYRYKISLSAIIPNYFAWSPYFILSSQHRNLTASWKTGFWFPITTKRLLSSAFGPVLGPTQPVGTVALPRV